MEQPKYRRVLLKISGEALAGEDKYGLNFDVLNTVAEAIKDCCDAGAQIGLVVGGGNIWRGVKNGSGKIERTRADQMGMLATTINALALCDVLEQHGVKAQVQTAIDMLRIAEPFTQRGAVRQLEEGGVVIFACGSGSPYFSTDTAAALRAAEIHADALLLAKNIDGVYDADPAKVPTAKKFDEISYAEVLRRGLGVMDTTATALAMDNNIPVVVFALKDPGNIKRVLMGEKLGTYVGTDVE
ncbi:MAG: UMP kinase [Clostridia bacterium]|nr:UMP kinase [Clostridia bacterium]